MKSLLLTAFDPFAHYTMNPSWEVVQALPETINNYHIHKLRVPNIFGLAPRLLLEEAQRVQPDVILMTGMNSGTTKIDINLAALNIKDALIEDNMGRKPWNEPILADAPAAYFATIPVFTCAEVASAAGVCFRRLCLQRNFLLCCPCLHRYDNEGWLCTCTVAAGNGDG